MKCLGGDLFFVMCLVTDPWDLVELCTTELFDLLSGHKINLYQVPMSLPLFTYQLSVRTCLQITMWGLSYWFCSAQLGEIWKNLAFIQFIHKKDRIIRMTSKYGHHDMLNCLIDCFIVRANQSQRCKTWRFGSIRIPLVWILTLSLASKLSSPSSINMWK